MLASLLSLALAPLQLPVQHPTETLPIGGGPTLAGITAGALGGDSAALGDDDGGSNGLVFVFDREPGERWTTVAAFGAPFGVIALGQDLALDRIPGAAAGERRLLAGAPGSLLGVSFPTDDRGAVLIYERDAGGGWQLEATWVADPDGTTGTGYGQSVDLDGDRAAIGQSLADQGTNRGAIYLRERQADGSWPTVFGYLAPQPGNPVLEVAIDGDVAAATVGGNPRTLWVFERGGAGAWSKVAQFTPSPGVQGTTWGIDLALDGGLIAVAAGFNAPFGGAVELFRREGGAWVQESPMVGAPGHVAGESFGVSVAIEDRALYVGGFRAPQGGLGGPGRRTTVDRFAFEGPGGPRWTGRYERVVDEFGSSATPVLDVDGTTLLAGPYLSFNPVSATVAAFRTDDLLASADELSLSAGGELALDLRAGEHLRHHPYWMLGSTTATTPGVQLAHGVTLPLVPDAWHATLLAQPNGPIAGSAGQLDMNGAAQATLAIPAGSDPSLAGVTVWHAYAVFEQGWGTAVRASRAVALELTP